MDAIKTEPEIDPLAVQPYDDAIREEENPSPDIFNMDKYQRKTDRKPFSQEQLDRARELLRNGESQSAVARALGVHEATLRKSKSGKAADSLGRFQKVFDNDMEKELEKHIQDLESRFYGLT
ncbi:uncharacterized protein [Periplaneta americana]|uniref:uncharacterized protein isoform X2 n=1 Tax=Periplaneta americana TaxID=6978 RepID=UPI0037E7AA81